MPYELAEYGASKPMETIPGAYLRVISYIADLQKICIRSAEDMQKICIRYAEDLQKICRRYA